MPANESSLRRYFIRRFNSKFVYQNCVFFANTENDYLLKIKKNTVN